MVYNDFFYDKQCTIYAISDTIVNGAEKKSKTALYNDIPCALWAISSNNLKDWPIGRQTDSATHKINIDWQYVGVWLWMIFVIWAREYIIVDLVSYDDVDRSVDNISFYVHIR